MTLKIYFAYDIRKLIRGVLVLGINIRLTHESLDLNVIELK